MTTNGHSTGSLMDFPKPGLWLIVLDGGCGYFARTTTEVTEEEVAHEMALTGHVKLTLRPIFVLDSVRGAIADANRNLVPMTIPIAQRIDQRIGLPDDFPVHMTAHAVVFLSEVSSITRTALLRAIDEFDRQAVEYRAKQAGIVTATR